LNIFNGCRYEDSAYWEGRFNNFDGIVTMWLTIDEATKENGCMGVSI
jgi:hypothetical protein